MILDRERAIREALAEPENDPAEHGFEVPEAVLAQVRDLPKAPPPSDAVLSLVHAVATNDAATILRSILTSHRQLEPGLVKSAVFALRRIEGEAAAAAEASAFAEYDIGLDLTTEFPLGLDFQQWTTGLRETHARVTEAGFSRLASANPRSVELEIPFAGEPAPRGFLAQRPWLIELILRKSPDSKAVVDQWWGLLIPALLNYMDTTDLVVKTRGVQLTTVLARRFGARLNYTGLTGVFEASVEPCLSFVPPMVEPECTKLALAPAVTCLGELALATTPPAITRLNYIAREGCLQPFLHAYENVELTIYFFDTLREFIDTYLQSLTAVHLSGIVRVFVQEMSNPFVDYSPALIGAASRAMASAIRWAWPRIEAYKYSILLGLTKANALDAEWFRLLQVSEEQSSELQRRAAELAAERGQGRAC